MSRSITGKYYHLEPVLTTAGDLKLGIDANMMIWDVEEGKIVWVGNDAQQAKFKELEAQLEADRSN